MKNYSLQVLQSTPIQRTKIENYLVDVKREDLCLTSEDGPPFSKMRGLFQRLKMLETLHVKTVGYTETSISMAGWGVAWLGAMIGMKVVIFNPVYKTPQPVLERHREHWKKWGADIIDIKAGMARVNFNISKKILFQKYPPTPYMLPLGLTLPETVTETGLELTRTLNIEKYKSIVVNVGSGTICAGILSGLIALSLPTHVYGIMGRKGNKAIKRKKIIGSIKKSAFAPSFPTLTLIDPGYQYTDSVEIETPFPCNKYYDKKAWKWLVENILIIEHPVLFWNIGKDTP